MFPGVTTSFGPQIVDATTCTSTGPVGNTYQTCTIVPNGTYPSYTYVPMPCFATTGTTGPSYTVTECNYPAATNYSNVPISQTGTCTMSSPNGGNNYLSVSCDHLAGANNTTVFVPPATCTANPGTSGSFILVTCAGPTLLTGPTLVDPTTCTPIGDTTGPGPNYVVNHCAKSPISYGQSDTCVAGNTGNPTWIQTDCVNSDGSSYVAPCTVGTTGTVGNSVTCAETVNIVNQPVAGSTCTNQSPNSGNNYLNIVCNTTTTFGPQVVDPTTCTVPSSTSSSTPFATTTCVTAPFGTYATPAYTDTCTQGTDGAFTVTQCSKGPLYNPTPHCDDRVHQRRRFDRG